MVNLQPYSGKLSREKMIFTEKTSASCSLVPPKDALPPNFAKKTFTNSQKTSKFTKDFSRKFPTKKNPNSLQDRQTCRSHRAHCSPDDIHTECSRVVPSLWKVSQTLHNVNTSMLEQ